VSYQSPEVLTVLPQRHREAALAAVAIQETSYSLVVPGLLRFARNDENGRRL
jgi:hypothetical protein